MIFASSVCPIGFLADKYGRKWVFVGSMAAEILSCYILLTAINLESLCVGMFLMGFAHPGRMIVAMSYADEFLPSKQKQWLFPINQYS